MAWAVTFRVSSVSSYLSLIFHAVVVEWLGFGVLFATLCWWVANHYLRLRSTYVFLRVICKKRMVASCSLTDMS